ncbi:MAG TPA: radical SAM protein [Ignavibacteria bacterium]|nr:radical SAM protein [Ignavibacteria bacterium]
MKVISRSGYEDIALVYIAETESGKLIEFVESLQSPLPREKKWVLIISTLYGCPVKCLICDAGLDYSGRISKEDLFAQIDYLVLKRYPDRKIKTEKFKIQFARMGEPAFNNAVLDVIEEFGDRYQAPGFVPSISTIAPSGRDEFFERLLQIKNSKFPAGKFQFQFSIHTTDVEIRDILMPVKKMSFSEMALFGGNFFRSGDNKLTLNFCIVNELPVEPLKIFKYFDPDKFIIKITPLNPTYSALQNMLTPTSFDVSDLKLNNLVEKFQKLSYEVIVSEGERIENQIGSNCGQYVLKHLKNHIKHSAGYKIIANIN